MGHYRGRVGDLNGTWDLNAGRSPTSTFTVSGLTAQGGDKEDLAKGKTPTTTVSLAGGLVSSSSTNSRLTFSARKR